MARTCGTVPIITKPLVWWFRVLGFRVNALVTGAGEGELFQVRVRVSYSMKEVETN